VLFSRRLSKLIYEVLLGRFNNLGAVSKFRESHEYFHLYRHQYGLAGSIPALAFYPIAEVAVHYYAPCRSASKSVLCTT